MEDRQAEFDERQAESFSTFLYNRDKGTVLGRTGASWGKIGLFYVLYYSFLAGFFSAMMTAFYQTLDDNRPTYIPGDGSSILLNPGMSPRPRSDRDWPIPIKFDSNGDVSDLTEQLDEFQKRNEDKQSEKGFVQCSDTRPPRAGESCSFPFSQLRGNCTMATSWGYKAGSPCIQLKMNKMIGWEPEVYTSMDELPEDMPEDLRYHIGNETAANSGRMPKMAWVSCSVNARERFDTEIDSDPVGGELLYSPWRGFPAYYFPYHFNLTSVEPIVAVEVPEPTTAVYVECRVWLKNVPYSRKLKLGMTSMVITPL